MFVYNAASAPVSTSASANTADMCMAIRQATRGVSLTALWLTGKAAAATAITGIAFRARRNLTQGTGGGAITLSPRWMGPTPSTSVFDKSTAFTPPTAGALLLVVGCPSVGGGGWTARDDASKAHLEGGSSDEIGIYSETAGTSALSFEIDAEIEE